MPSNPAASYEDYERWVRSLTAHAHRCGVAVEAEIGTLPLGVAPGTPAGGSMTDPDRAARFVTATGIDLLAVSVGNVHIRLTGADELDLGHLEKIREKVPVPFVLHGGTGIAVASIHAAIRLGVCKVNYGTYLKQRYLAALRAALGRDIADPHELLGRGGDHDLLVTGRRAVRDAVLERIDLLGCCGKA